MAQDPSGSSKDPKDKPGRGNLPSPPAGRSTAGQPPPGTGGAGGHGDRSGADASRSCRRSAAGGLPIAVTQAPLTLIDLRPRLVQLTPVTVAFPPCSDVLLALINRQTTPEGRHHQVLRTVLPRSTTMRLVFLPPNSSLEAGAGPWSSGACVTTERRDHRFTFGWPPPWCLPPSCMTLNGNRLEGGAYPPPLHPTSGACSSATCSGCSSSSAWASQDPGGDPGRLRHARRLSDLQRLRWGATGSEAVAALVLEAMCRQSKAGLSSTVRDRDASYRRGWGWTSDVGRPWGSRARSTKGRASSSTNSCRRRSASTTAKRLAICHPRHHRAWSDDGVAGDAGRDLRYADVAEAALRDVPYGRTYYNTLSGIVWTIAGLTVLRELRTTLGIPAAFDEPHEFIPAAYDLLVLKRPPTQTEINRYEAHKDCAEFGRNLLIDIEVLDERDTRPEIGELDRWLAQVEGDIEGYRKAYRDLTGVDLGAQCAGHRGSARQSSSRRPNQVSWTRGQVPCGTGALSNVSWRSLARASLQTRMVCASIKSRPSRPCLCRKSMFMNTGLSH